LLDFRWLEKNIRIKHLLVVRSLDGCLGG